MNNLNETIQLLSSKVNIPIEKIHNILQNQMIFQMKSDIFWLVVSIFIFIVGYFRIKKHYEFIKTIERYQEDHQEFWVVVAWGLAIAGFLIAFICNMTDLIQIKVNPDYYMFQLLVNSNN